MAERRGDTISLSVNGPARSRTAGSGPGRAGAGRRGRRGLYDADGGRRAV